MLAKHVLSHVSTSGRRHMDGSTLDTAQQNRAGWLCVHERQMTFSKQPKKLFVIKSVLGHEDLQHCIRISNLPCKHVLQCMLFISEQEKMKPCNKTTVYKCAIHKYTACMCWWICE